MAIKLSSLRKVESTPASVQSRQVADDDQLVVLVKVRQGYARPKYLAPRGDFAPNLFSAEVAGSTLARIEADPAVESVAVSQRLPGIR